VIPGKVNSFAVTIDKAGLFKGKCTEYCGVDHDRMLFSVRAVDHTTFQQWLSDTKALAASGNDARYSVYTGPAVPTDSNATNVQRSH
jgi:cytochrome c oxidase subunit II